jgi:hypothetical protein
MVMKGEYLNLADFYAFLCHNFDFGTWCRQCRKEVLEKPQEETIKHECETTFQYHFELCYHCDHILMNTLFM